MNDLPAQVRVTTIDGYTFVAVAVDKIVRWDEVREGNFVLEGGMLALVDKIRPPNTGHGWQEFDISPGGTISRNNADLTAVRRYVESELHPTSHDRT
jgi:hypothetical protein